MIPQNSIISEEQVIARIKIDLELTDTTEHDSHLEILLREGLGSLNCLSQLEKKNCVLKAQDNTMKMPDDVIRFVALKPKAWLPCDASNPIFSNIAADCHRFIYADTAFLNSCGCGDSRFVNYKNGFQINKGYIHFNSHTQIDEAMISYMGMWKDENGKRAIFERFERALTAYACWKFIRSKKKDSQYIMQDYKLEWINQKDFLRGQDVKTDFDNNKLAISELMRALIVSPIVLVP